MKKDLFENIGQKLNEYQSPVDLDKEWNDLLDQQSRRRQRRQRIRFLGIFSSLMLSLIIFFYFANYYFEASNTTNVKSQHLIEFNNSEQELIKPDLTLDKDQSVENNKIDQIKQPKQSQQSTTENSRSLSSAISDANKITAKSSKVDISVNRNKSIKSATQSQNINNSDFNLIKENSAKSNNLISQISILPKLPTIQSLVENSNTQDEKEKMKKLIILPTVKRKNQLFFNAGIGITHQSFRARDNEWKHYSDLRNESEKPLETYIYELGLNVPFRKKSFLRMSASYNISFDKINHSYDRAREFFLQDILIERRFYPQSGTVEEVFGDTTVLGSQTVNNTQFNKYTSVNLNLLLGYDILTKNRFNIAFTGGLFYNIYLNTSGKIISSENEMSPLEPIHDYKRSFGLGLSGGLDIDYHLHKSWIISLRPSSFYSLSSATTESNKLKSNFHQYGISLGIKYKLQ